MRGQGRSCLVLPLVTRVKMATAGQSSTNNSEKLKNASLGTGLIYGR